MDTRILEIVFYLMDHMHDGEDQSANLSEYSSDLKSLGFSDEEISSAYNWILDHLTAAGEPLYSDMAERPGAARILTDFERARLTPEAQGFLRRLLNLGMIENNQFEKLLDRLSQMGPRQVTADQAKLIASALIFQDFGNLDQLLRMGGTIDSNLVN